MEVEVYHEHCYSTRKLCVALAPGMLTAVIHSGGQVVAHSDIVTQAGTGAPPWEVAVAALREYLRQSGSSLRGVPLSLSISERFGLAVDEAMLGALRGIAEEFGHSLAEVEQSPVPEC